MNKIILIESIMISLFLIFTSISVPISGKLLNENIEIGEPELKIQFFRVTLLIVRVRIKNTGDLYLTEIDYHIKASKINGSFRYFDKEGIGQIYALPSGEKANVGGLIIIGTGKVNLSITVEPSEGGYFSANTTRFVFFPFIFGNS